VFNDEKITLYIYENTIVGTPLKKNIYNNYVIIIVIVYCSENIYKHKLELEIKKNLKISIHI